MSTQKTSVDLTAAVTTVPFQKRTAWWKIAIGVAVVAFLIAAPLMFDVQTVQTLARIGVYAVAVLGLNLIMGYTGVVSLGQIFFVGFGAYVTAYGVGNGWPLVLTIVAAIVLPGLAGLLIAFAAARLGGLAIAMVTIALPIIGVPLAKRLSDLTGGSQGTSAAGFANAPDWSGLANDQWQYYVVLLFAGAAFACVFNLTRGKFGRGLAIVKENENVAKSMGISPYRYKVMAFTIASMLGGLSGFLYMVVVQFTSPETLAFHHSIDLVAAMVVGGAGSIVGALLGGAYYVLIPIVTNEIASTLTLFIKGAILLLVLFILPGGLASIPHRIRRLMRRKTTADAPDTAAAPTPDQEQRGSS